MGKKLYITIDTEMDADIHWKKVWPSEYTSIYDGIPNFFRPLWDRLGAHPIYLLSPEILYDERCCDIFKDEIVKGAQVGAHLHPEYIKPDMCPEVGRQTRASQFPHSAYDRDTERSKLINLTNMIEDKLGVRPIWYRAARFGADKDTYISLDELGYKHETSVTPGIDWSDRGGIDYRDYCKDAYSIEGTGLTEHPVTILGKRWGVIGRLLPDNWLFYRWLRPTHMTYIELKHLIAESDRQGSDELVMMFHSMEPMINKTPYVRWAWMQKYYMWRLEKTLKYAKKLGYEL